MKINVWSNNLKVNQRMKMVAQRRITYALRAFSSKIREVDVFLSNLDGSREGKSRHCRITVNLKNIGPVIVNDYQKRFAQAITKGADRLKHSLSRKLEKQRGHRGAKLARVQQLLESPSL